MILFLTLANESLRAEGVISEEDYEHNKKEIAKKLKEAGAR